MCANLFATSYAIKYSKKKAKGLGSVSDLCLPLSTLRFFPSLAHSLLIDNFQAMTLILIQGCQDAYTIMQIVHHILDLHVLPGKGAWSSLSCRRCLVLQKDNGKRKTLGAFLGFIV